MQPNKVVTREEWLEARLELLAREKAFTRERDALSRSRRSLPWVEVDKTYMFESEKGAVSLAGLFEGRSQLIVYHFMFGDDWEEGCTSCSFWADGYNPVIEHLKARDISLVAVSTAPVEKLTAYRDRLGWSFPWVSAGKNRFNQDFAVTFDADEIGEDARNYNFGTSRFGGSEAPGLSVFTLGDNGTIYHSYSTYGRGLDIFNAAYHYMDAVPKGRDEEGLSHSMSWLRRRDQY